MARYVAFLRAINVGGHVVKMDMLRSLLVDIGFDRVETFIASGNVIFESKARDAASLERRIEKALHQALGYEVATFIRSDAEIGAICAYQPFTPKRMAEAAVSSVGFLSAPLGQDAVKTMHSYDTDLDSFHTNEREFYWMSKTRHSESPFFKVRFEKVFKANVTFRNMTTVRRLHAKYPPRG
ncbi:MAG: DUF1697 domain-containing protein [Gemmatimonadaceae bacterium]